MMADNRGADMESGHQPRFALRILLGLILSLAFWSIIQFFPGISRNWQMPIAVGLGVFASAILLYLFEIRRHA